MESLELIRDYAHNNNVPIMTDEGISFLTDYIKSHNVKSILEIGAAIGYSSIMMCLVDEGIFVTTIERDKERYDMAIENISDFKLNDRINLIFGDALECDITGKYDLIFIDAAKAQNIKFFEKYKINLKDTGTIITDNMNFHGFVDLDMKEIHSRNLRQLVRKLKKYQQFLLDNEEFSTEFLNTGDGVAISVRK